MGSFGYEPIRLVTGRAVGYHTLAGGYLALDRKMCVVPENNTNFLDSQSYSFMLDL